MPNPFDDLFENPEEEKKSSDSKFDLSNTEDDRFPTDDKESLDEILSKIQEFNQEAESFSQLLSKTRAVDHKVESPIMRFFLVSQDKHEQLDLASERKYHDLLKSKFETIIAPMRSLAQIHLQTIQQFNNDIDENYYSVEKTDRSVKAEKAQAVDGITLQRKILADATSSLEILRDASADTERRIKTYVNAGGENNISSAEYEMIVQKRTTLTNGQDHQFDYSFFDVNLLDKTAISLGIYMKKTTSQYLGKLLTAFELK